MKVRQVIQELFEAVPKAVLVDPEGYPWGEQQMQARLLSQQFGDEITSVEQTEKGEAWRLGSAGLFRVVVPELLEISTRRYKNRLTTAKLIAAADSRLGGIIHYMGEWMLWASKGDGDPFLMTVEYWVTTRAEVFRRFAEQTQGALAAEQEDPEEDEGEEEVLPIFLTGAAFRVPEGETVH